MDREVNEERLAKARGVAARAAKIALDFMDMCEDSKLTPALPQGTNTIVDLLCDRFEQAWLTGGTPEIGAFLDSTGLDGPVLPVLFRELLGVELFHRHRLGQPVCLEDYQRRFPEYREIVDAVGGLATRSHSDGDADTAWPPPSPAAPADFGDRFQVVRCLGAGGMGVVYHVFDLRRGEPVALKTLLHTDPVAQYRFKREFRLLSELSHPNLVSLYELLITDRFWCFTMELIDGVDILTALAGESGDRERADRLCGYLLQLTEGLAVLHRAQRMHRDVKPSNVLVTRDGRIVLLDFGLVGELDSQRRHQTTDAHVLGTVAYMAPEQAAGGAASPASDLYAAGVILYEALTGRRPFEGPPLAILAEKQRREAPDLQAVRPGVCPDLSALCAELLARDPRRRPDIESLRTRLASRCGQVVRVPDRPAAGAEAFVGRNGELQVLHRALNRVRQGRTAVVAAVEGPAGLGKTTLIRHFLEALRPLGGHVLLQGRCHERELVPFNAFDALIEDLSRALMALPRSEVEALLPRDVTSLLHVFPALKRVPSVATAPSARAAQADRTDLRRRAFAALQELFGRLADRRPTVLWIDDVHWTDEDSLALLESLLRPPHAPALLLILSFRPEYPLLRRLLDVLQGSESSAGNRPELVRLVLLPLEPAESRALMRQWDPSFDRRRLDALVVESEGNPFLLQTLARAAGEVSTGDPADTGRGGLKEVLWRRIASLPGPAQELLAAVAVAGQPLLPGHAAAACGRGESWATAHLQLTSQRWLRVVNAGPDRLVDCYHERIRETILERMAAARRATLHLALARALEGTPGVSAEALAIHYRDGGEPSPAADYFAAAALAAAEVLAFVRAARLQREAIRLVHDPDRAAHLRARLADYLAEAGCGTEAADEYARAAEHLSGSEAQECRRKAGLQLLMSGHVDRGVKATRQVLAEYGVFLPESPLPLLAEIVKAELRLRFRGYRVRSMSEKDVPADTLAKLDAMWSCGKAVSLVDVFSGYSLHLKTLLLALQTGEPHRVLRSLLLHIAHLATRGRRVRAKVEQLQHMAEPLVQELGDPYLTAWSELAKGIFSHLNGRWLDCNRRCDAARTTFLRECTGVSWELGTAATFSNWALEYAGQLGETHQRRQELVADARARGDVHTEINLRISAFRVLLSGDPAAEHAELDRALQQWTSRGFSLQHHNALVAHAYADLYAGCGARGLERLRESEQSFRATHVWDIQQMRIDYVQCRAICAVAAIVDTGKWQRYYRQAMRDARRLRREGWPWADATANLVAGGLAWLSRDRSQAVEGLQRAYDKYHEAGMLLFASAVGLRLGKLLGASRGERLVADAESWLAAQGIPAPESVAAALVPGFERTLG